MHARSLENTQEARAALGYRLEQLLRFFRALQTSRVHPFNNFPAQSRGISSDAKIRRYSARLSRIIVLLFNKLITKQLVTFLNLSVDIFSLFLPTCEVTYIAGYLLPTDDRYREHHEHIWIVLKFVE